MAIRSSLSLLVIALGALALFAWWSSAPQTGEAPTPQPSAIEVVLAPAPDLSVLPESNDEAGRREIGSGDVQPATAQTVETPRASGRVHVSGVVLAHRDLAVGATVSIQRMAASSLEAPPDSASGVTVRRLFSRGRNVSPDRGRSVRTGPDGAYRFVVSRLVADARERRVEREGVLITFWALVEPLGAPPREFEITVAARPEFLDDSRDVEFVADFDLRSACVLRGSASTTDAQPSALSLAAFRMVDGKPEAEAAAICRIEPTRSEFTLTFEDPGDYAIVACAPGYRPESRVVLVHGLVRLDDLVLTRGISLSGFARVAGQGVAGQVRAELVAPESRELVPRCSLPPHWLAWTGERFEWNTVFSSCGANSGAFEFHGLATAEYDLALRGVFGVYAPPLPPIRASAPTNAVELAPSVCRVEVLVFEGGEPAVDKTLRIDDVGPARTHFGTHRTDATGAARLWVAPGHVTTIVVDALAWDASPTTVRRRITCPAAGESVSVRIDL